MTIHPKLYKKEYTQYALGNVDQFHTACRTNSDQQLVRKDMDATIKHYT